MSNISWQTYFITFAIITAVYYAVIIILFYRRDLVKASRPRINEVKPDSDSRQTGQENSPDPKLLSAVHELMGELKNTFHNAKNFDYPKEELFMALQVAIRDYKVLKGTAFQEKVSEHIMNESKLMGANLTATDIRNLWTI